MEYEELSKKLRQYPRIYLYGAGVVAYGVYRAISELFGMKAVAFLVTEEKGQPTQIDGIPVYPLKELQINGPGRLILIAAPEEYHRDMEKELTARGEEFIKIDSHMEYALMGDYLKKVHGLKRIEEYVAGREWERDNQVGVYMAVSHKDKPLRGNYEEDSWIKRIQVGAALADERIADLTDEGSDSISIENELYGELTATYYVWKYGQFAVTGLFHYRRVLSVSGQQLNLLKEGSVHAVLPLPFVCYPNASGQYGRYLLPTDVETMLAVIAKREPESMKEILRLLQEPYLYNYNMLIARREVFDDYCRWMFPILKETTTQCEKRKAERLPRYIGRIGEVLTSLYFMRNVKNWEIAHAKKIWRV